LAKLRRSLETPNSLVLLEGPPSRHESSCLCCSCVSFFFGSLLLFLPAEKVLCWPRRCEEE
jgi:hypothetical protein